MISILALCVFSGKFTEPQKPRSGLRSKPQSAKIHKVSVTVHKQYKNRILSQPGRTVPYEASYDPVRTQTLF